MKNLLISLIFVSSVVSQVSAFSWNDIASVAYESAAIYTQNALAHFDFRSVASAGTTFVQENKYKLGCSVAAIAGTALLYKAFKALNKPEVTVHYNEIITVTEDVNGHTVYTTKRDGKTVSLTPEEGFRILNNRRDQIDKEFAATNRQSKALFNQMFPKHPVLDVV